MRINPDSWHAIALHTVTYGQGVALEHIGQQGDGLVAALGNVHPHQCVGALQRPATSSTEWFSIVPAVNDRTRIPAIRSIWT